MSKNVVKLETTSDTSVIRNHLTDREFAEFEEICSHPHTIGHVLFNPDAEVIASENFDEADAAALANVFDICGDLTESFGQNEHVSTVFEGREKEITCRRLSAARLVYFRGKGNFKAGG